MKNNPSMSIYLIYLLYYPCCEKLYDLPLCPLIPLSGLVLQGANKNGTAPDGTSYLDAAEKDEIKALLR